MQNKIDISLIKKSLENIEIGKEKKERIIAFLGLFKKGEYLYPNVLIRNAKISKEKAECIFKELIVSGIVKKMYAYNCDACGYLFQHLYEEKLEKDEELHCENCDNIIDIKNYEIFYVFV